MNVPMLDLVAQYHAIKDEVLPAMMKVIETQQFIMGAWVPQLEAEVARLSHARHGIGCASGTDALLLPLKALNLKPGDEVITTPFTFFATAGTIHNAGGTPVFVDIQAAILLAKLPHLAAWSARRREHAAYYTKALADVPQVLPPVVDPANEHIFHQYTLRAQRRDELAAHLKKEGIGHAVYYPVPLHRQPCFAHLGYRDGSLPHAEQAAREAISLPIYPELTRAQLDRVIDAIRGFYR